MLFKFVIVCIYFYITINLVVSFPIQLIVSDEFNKLSITNEGKEFLLKINNKVEVVSITGPYHSGKSLVLNTLLNIDQNENFKVDNKISSTTKGIWFNTRLLNNSNNDKQVLLLDTEGFSSIENNKDFDSMIFGTATLLSSHVIYTCMKNLDKNVIDILESYIIGTDIFNVYIDSKNNNPNVFKFADKLTFLISDLTTEFEDGENLKMFVETITNPKKKKKENESLITIFPDISGFELPSAATSKKMKKIGTLSRDELEVDYIHSINEFKSFLFDEINSDGRTGPEILNTLSAILVKINNPDFSNLNSIWIEQTEKNGNRAYEKTIKFGENLLKSALPSNSIDIPLNTIKFNERVEEIYTICNDYYYNLKEISGRRYEKIISSSFIKTIEKLKYEANEVKDENNGYIKRYCQSQRNHIKYIFDNFCDTLRLNFPYNSDNLKIILTDKINILMEEYNNHVHSLFYDIDVDGKFKMEELLNNYHQILVDNDLSFNFLIESHGKYSLNQFILCFKASTISIDNIKSIYDTCLDESIIIYREKIFPYLDPYNDHLGKFEHSDCYENYVSYNIDGFINDIVMNVSNINSKISISMSLTYETKKIKQLKELNVILKRFRNFFDIDNNSNALFNHHEKLLKLENIVSYEIVEENALIDTSKMVFIDNPILEFVREFKHVDYFIYIVQTFDYSLKNYITFTILSEVYDIIKSVSNCEIDCINNDELKQIEEQIFLKNILTVKMNDIHKLNKNIIVILIIILILFYFGSNKTKKCKQEKYDNKKLSNEDDVHIVNSINKSNSDSTRNVASNIISESNPISTSSSSKIKKLKKGK